MDVGCVLRRVDDSWVVLREALWDVWPSTCRNDDVLRLDSLCLAAVRIYRGDVEVLNSAGLLVELARVDILNALAVVNDFVEVLSTPAHVILILHSLG